MLTEEAREVGEHTLKRSLGALNLVTLGVGAVIGAGIFTLTGQAAALRAGPAVALSFVLAGLTCAFAGLCYAEFASIIPIAGSAYTYGYATLGELVAWIRRLRPVVVLGHDPTAVFFGEEYFNHRDHRVTGFAVLDALSPAAALPHYFPEAGPAHQVETALLSGTLEPNVWVDVTATIDDKAKAVSCHRSQFTDDVEWARRAVRQRAGEDGRRAGVAFAEGFRRLRLGG